MDLLAVLLAPRLLASALYYKTKLCVHNFTLYDVVTRDVTCYVWHEGEGGVTANEFASCVVDYLNEHLQYDTFVTVTAVPIKPEMLYYQILSIILQRTQGKL